MTVRFLARSQGICRSFDVSKVSGRDQKGSQVNPDMDDALHLNMPALPENLALVRAAVGERAEAYGVSSPLVADLKTVVSEACANVVVHAYVGAPDPGPLEVEMTRDTAKVKVVVRDRGVGIRPQAKTVRTSLKMGLLLIGAISNSFQLRSARDRGTELSMVLALPARG
jgi:serine/threonine-protein kinase RsbW